MATAPGSENRVDGVKNKETPETMNPTFANEDRTRRPPTMDAASAHASSRERSPKEGKAAALSVAYSKSISFSLHPSEDVIPEDDEVSPLSPRPPPPPPPPSENDDRATGTPSGHSSNRSVGWSLDESPSRTGGGKLSALLGGETTESSVGDFSSSGEERWGRDRSYPPPRIGGGRRPVVLYGESSSLGDHSNGDDGRSFIPRDLRPPPPPPPLPLRWDETGFGAHDSSGHASSSSSACPTDDDWRRALLLPHPQRQRVGTYGSVRSVATIASLEGTGLRDGDSSSVVFAPEDAPVPPKTPLWGSSRFVANVKHIQHVKDELDRQSTGNLSERPVMRTRTNFYEDAITFAEGTIPQSILLALAFGIACGLVAYVYYLVFFFLLEFIWHTLPQKIVVGVWPEWAYVLWIPTVTFTMSLCSGLSIYLLGEPGDLAYTVKCVHEKAYESTSHILPMFFASLFSLLGGASCGPEAPIVSICAATSGYMSRKIFRQRNRNVVRKHTLMGMAGALSAFFGVPLGGSLFALEINSRFGVEYFEHMIEAIFCGVVCLTVFRGLSGLRIGPIWSLSTPRLEDTDALMVVVGGVIGLLGAGIATIFATFHWRLMDLVHAMGLVDDANRRAVPRALLGATAVSIIGVLVPHSLFWGEFEFESIATLAPASELPHVWPPNGLLGFEIGSWSDAAIVGFCKIVAISFTIAAGYRGGYIFPFFTAGAAFGRAVVFLFPFIRGQIACLCFAAGINVAITRTALATPLILAFLAGEHNALPAILAASIVSLFATSYMPFIKSQIIRSDLDHSLFYKKGREPMIQETVRSVAELLLDGESGDVHSMV